MNNIIKRIKWFRFIGLAFTIAVCLFIVIFNDLNFYNERLQPYLFDFGVNTIGSCFTVALFYGCLRQEGPGTKIFRALIVLVATCFLVTELTLLVMGIPELKTLCYILTIISKLLDLALIFLFYYYVKRLLELDGKLVKITDKILPILLVLQVAVILSNIFYPVTFYYTAEAVYTQTSISMVEDIFLALASIIAVVLILLSHNPIRQKISALTFIVFPLIGYVLVGGSFSSATQYGLVLMSLIVMYCVIFNDKTKKMMATEAELNMASTIQMNMLPLVFPPFPERNEFDIFASMNPAKEVGGDFYDFFMIDDDHLAIVIADVSGKGVPAALFMMSSKILINDHALIGGSPSKILERVNELVYANNKAHMFVTVWLGILEISTGKLVTSNAGHEYPIININGKYELLKDKHGIAIGAVPNSKYVDTEIMLKSGDQIFVYTDGVAEATDLNKQLFGTERTVEALNSLPKGISQQEVLESVKKAVDSFVKEAPQFDDITMVGLKYIGPNAKENLETEKDIKELVVEANVNNLDSVQEFVDAELENVECPMAAQMAIDVAVEEIFVNIANYAYGSDSGDAIIQVSMNDDPLAVEITFIDFGKEYNPLAKPDPNTSLSLMERQKGGLGIFMVKKSMDDMIYEYKDGRNILKIIKKI